MLSSSVRPLVGMRRPVTCAVSFAWPAPCARSALVDLVVAAASRTRVRHASTLAPPPPRPFFPSWLHAPCPAERLDAALRAHLRLSQPLNTAEAGSEISRAAVSASSSSAAAGTPANSASDQPSAAAHAAAGGQPDYQCNVQSFSSSALGAAAAIAGPSAPAPTLASAAQAVASALTAAEGGRLCIASVGQRGFINVRLRDEWLLDHAREVVAGSASQEPSSQSAAKAEAAKIGEDVSTMISGSGSGNGTGIIKRRRILVDLGSPNVGKELHVGHLRSGVVGDALVRILRARGAEVDAVSHVGDAGLPAALVLWELGRRGSLEPAVLAKFWQAAAAGGGLHAPTIPQDLTPHGLSEVYTEAKRRTSGGSPAALSGDAEVHATLRLMQRVLQKVAAAVAAASSVLPPAAPRGTGVLEGAGAADVAGLTPEERNVHEGWRALCAASRMGYAPLLSRLGVGATEAVLPGAAAPGSGKAGQGKAGGSPRGELMEQSEACYAHLLPSLVQNLLDSGMAVVDDGAVAVFVDPSTPPLLARKADGGFLYATTDLAAIRARLAEGYDGIVYVTDMGQGPHFAQVFRAAAKAGWVVPAAGEEVGAAAECAPTPVGGSGLSAAADSALAPQDIREGTKTSSNRKKSGGPSSGRAAGAPSQSVLLNNLHPSGVPSPVSLQHAGFGVVTGPGGRKLSSRDGTSELTLARLLDEGAERLAQLRAELAKEKADAGAASDRLRAGAGEDRARLQLQRPAPEHSAAEGAVDLARALSASCARFHDLLHQRNSAYAFDMDRVLDVKGRGDSATYVLYARQRLRTLRAAAASALAVPSPSSSPVSHPPAWPTLILAAEARAAAAKAATPAASTVTSSLASPTFASDAAPQERALARAVAALPDSLAAAEKGLAPHHAAHAALSLAAAAHAFYTAVRILPAGAATSATPLQLDEDGWGALRRRMLLAGAAEQGLAAACEVLGLAAEVERM